MRRYKSLLIFVSLICANAQAQSSIPEDQRDKIVAQAIELISQGKYADAVATVDPVLAAFDSDKSDDTKETFCASYPAQTLMILAGAAAAGKDRIVLNSTWCDALFAKGFALIDLKHLDDAGPFLKKAAEMAPLNSHYINEYAEWHKSKRNWQAAYDLFEQARSVIGFAPENFKTQHEARSLRGMGFCLIELGKLDQAENMFHQSLKLTPENQAALSELQYIKDLRKSGS